MSGWPSGNEASPEGRGPGIRERLGDIDPKQLRSLEDHAAENAADDEEGLRADAAEAAYEARRDREDDR